MCTNPFIHDQMHRAPVPVIRLWLWLVTSSPSGYSGTPADLYDRLRSSGASISRKVLPRSIATLEEAGMVEVRRRGHHLRVALVQVSG